MSITCFNNSSGIWLLALCVLSIRIGESSVQSFYLSPIQSSLSTKSYHARMSLLPFTQPCRREDRCGPGRRTARTASTRRFGLLRTDSTAEKHDASIAPKKKKSIAEHVVFGLVFAFYTIAVWGLVAVALFGLVLANFPSHLYIVPH